MSQDKISGESQENEPEVRLELTNQGVRQVWALYSQERTDGEGFRESDPTYSFFLRDLPGLLWRGKWYLASSLAAAIAIAALYVINTTPVYNVGALVLVEKRPVPLNEGARTFSGSNFLATQAEVIQSPTIIYRAIDGMPREVLEQARRNGVEDPLKMMVASFSSTRVVGTDVVALTLRAQDRLLGERLVTSIIESYREYLREFERSGYVEALDLVRRNEADLRAQLEDLQNHYQQLRSEGGSLGQGRDALGIQRAVLERQAQKLVEARMKRIELENQLASMRSSDGRIVDLVGEGSQKLQEELWKAQVHVMELQQRYSPDHPELRAVSEQIVALKGQLAASQRQAPAQLERELRATRETERRLTRLYETDFERGKELDAHQMREQGVLAEIERSAKLHDAALERLQERELQLKAISLGDGGVVVKLLDGPGSSDTPMWPQPTLVFICAAIVGIAIGLGLTLVLERVNAQRAVSESALPVTRTARGGFRPAAVETTESAPIRPSVVDMARES